MHKVIIHKSKLIAQQLMVPSSKSYGHRALIIAALANGISKITNLDENDDLKATIDCLRKLGVKIIKEGNTYTVIGTNAQFKKYNGVLNCQESGSTLRFLIAVSLLQDQLYFFTGTQKLLTRPLSIYQNLAFEKDFFWQKNDQLITVKGPLKAGYYQIPANISSQFISALLMVLVLLKDNSTLELVKPIVSRSYIDMTLEIMKLAGIDVEQVENKFNIKGQQHYHAFNYQVEADYSSAAFFYALAYLHHTKISILNLNKESKQADRKIIYYLDNLLTLKTIDLQNCPDLGPVLMSVAAYQEKEIHFSNIRNLRYKESDRIQAMQEELKKLGVKVRSTENEAWVMGNKKLFAHQVLDGHNDHRIVMALSILATLTNDTTILQAEAVQKSYPSFFDDLAKVGIIMERG